MQQAIARKRHWTLDDIPWMQFEPSKVDPDIVKLVKAAAMVEHNGGDYGTYLCNVFHDDPEFQQVALQWAAEEVQHGAALAAWAKLADSSFDFETSFKRFTEGFRIQTDARASIRGSRSGELVARCIVETGTSSYYSALKDVVSEPVLKEICRNIAADEHRHYKLFYDYLRRYLKRENIGRWKRLLVAIGRLRESEDDELAYAYHAANEDAKIAYDRRRCSAAYAGRAYGLYRRVHIERGIAMALKAAGLTPNGRLNAWLTRLGCWLFSARSRRFAASGV